MREIKFRVWDSKNKKWFSSGKRCCHVSYTTENFGLNKNFILQQLTGLKDINGKDIYEGDILSSEVNEKPCNYIVKWGEKQSEYCGFVLNPVMKNPPRITYHIHDFKIWMAQGFKVIGNVFENSELTHE